MKQIKTVLALLTLFSAAAFAQEKGSFADARDKKTYKTVKIGEQVWMAENLNFNAKGSKCYDNKEANCKKYGRLYNKEMAKASCPAGWHLPSKEEWKALLKAAGIDEYESLSTLKAKSGWKPDDGGGNGTDKFGFAALPGGLYGPYDHSEECGGSEECQGERGEAFMHGSDNGFWHSANDGYGFDGYYYVYNVPPFNYMWLGGWYYSNTSFLSVRCVKGSVEAVKAKAEKEKAREAYIKANGGTFIDARDKKTYKTVKIGTQTWMAENLNYDDKSSKCYKDEYYPNEAYNCAKYGRLYNWESAMKACPAGWHLPANTDWDKLFRYADGASGTESSYNSETAGKLLKAKEGWDRAYDSDVANGTDNFGFTALPGGYGDSGGGFDEVGFKGFWWSATESKASYASACIINDFREYAGLIDSNKKFMSSVRCVKD